MPTQFPSPRLRFLGKKKFIINVFTDKPEILTTENKSKTASNAGMLAKLHCQAVGAPTIRFSWEHDGSNIINVTEKYVVEQKRVSINLIDFEIFFFLYI